MKGHWCKAWSCLLMLVVVVVFAAALLPAPLTEAAANAAVGGQAACCEADYALDCMNCPDEQRRYCDFYPPLANCKVKEGPKDCAGEGCTEETPFDCII